MRNAALAAILAALPILNAQPVTDFDHFEVASVRRSAPPTTPAGMIPAPKMKGGPGTSDPGQIAFQGIQLGPLIILAYDVDGFRLQLPPSVVPLDRYDIVAKIPAGATQAQYHVMLQNLLKDRFNLSVHKETRDTPVYLLQVGPKGSKLKQSAKLDDPAEIPPGTPLGRPNAEGFPTFPPSYSGMMGMPGPGRMLWSAQRVPLSNLARFLEDQVRRPVMDRTGLTGDYDFQMEIGRVGRPGAIPLSPAADATPADAPTDTPPDVFQAVDRLGLKLESSKLPLEVIVVDHIDREPVEN